MSTHLSRLGSTVRSHLSQSNHNPLYQSVRQATHVHYYQKYRKTNSVDLALQHFDTFYSKVYPHQWPSIRLGLLSPNKYMAMINHFGRSEEVQIGLRQQGAYDLAYVYEKNLRRVLRHLERKKWLKQRENDLRVEGTDHPAILNSGVTSDSEFEEIGAFFTDSEGDSSGTFVNPASLELDLNDYVPVSDLKYGEEIVDDREYFHFYDINSEVPVQVVDQGVLNYPTNLSLFSFPRSDFANFEPPKLKNSAVLDYYLIDGASALPALVLDIQDGDHVADFCAAPGGKSLLLFLTLKNCRFFLNDISLARFKRLQTVFNTFIPRSSQASIEFSNVDAVKLAKRDAFDKILVDAPCTNDRHSLYVNDNNMFNPKRIQERVAMPLRQMDLLLAALEAVKPGGTVVYSTCSLSPIQNDGVVHMALKRIGQMGERSFSVVNVKEAMRPLRGLYRFNHNFKYGTQVLPFVPSNFGPMYFCKLVRNG